MKALVCGASGFIGRHIVLALREAGHEVVRGVARPQEAGDVAMDFARDTAPAAWHARLSGIDAVVNAVGVLRSSARRPIDAVHRASPVALFQACAAAGVRRVVHVSALGIDGNPTDYARTKLAAEEALLSLDATGQLDATVLRPSIVFGEGGQSSELFLNLARLPWLVLPQAAISTKVQPVHVLELAQAVVRLLRGATPLRGRIELVGPEATALAGFIASLRAQKGHAPARLTGLPDRLTRLSARMGDLVPITPWGSQALSLLTHDNVADAAATTRLLGRAPTHYSRLLAEVPA